MMVKVVGAMKRRGIRNLLRHAALVAVTFIMVYPILWMFFSSFKPDDQIFSTSSLWPETWTLEHYLAGFNGELGMNFGRLMWNSLIISAVVVVGTIFSSVGAFALTNGSRDAALVVTLMPGAYSAQVSGINSGTGEALVEVYEVP